MTWEQKYKELWEQFKAASDLLRMAQEDENELRLQVRRQASEIEYLKSQLEKLTLARSKDRFVSA